MSAIKKPVTILISAMGGEGGGVLAGWIVDAAVAAGLPAQRTSIPGVAQRTGATTYYIEIYPEPWSEQDGPPPVLSLNPSAGGIDILVATELLEAARAMQRGFVTPDRTMLIASTHRVFTIHERSAMGDNRFDGQKALEAAGRLAKSSILLDMDALARASKAHINTIILGVLAASGRLPVPEAILRKLIGVGPGADRNLIGFDAGIEAVTAHAAADIAAHAKRRTPAGSRQDLDRLIATHIPDGAREIVAEGVARLIDYQSPRYAQLYLDRLQPLLATGIDDSLLRETARHLAVLMSFEDIIRVGQLKSRPERFARVRAEVRAAPGQLVDVIEFFKPGVEEICGVLPSGLARPILAWTERRPGRPLSFPMKIKSTTVGGYLRLWGLAKLRRWRPYTHNYAEMQKLIEAWLRQVYTAAQLDRGLALEVAELARLVKGYSDTLKRGVANYRLIADRIVGPALSGELRPGLATDAIFQARKAALADDEGKALGTMLASFEARITKAAA